jgi:hypothetical protein
VQVCVHGFLTQVKPLGQEPPVPHAGKSRLGKNVQPKAVNRPHTLPPPNFLWQKQSGLVPQRMFCPPPEQSKPCPLQTSHVTHVPFWQHWPVGQVATQVPFEQHSPAVWHKTHWPFWHTPHVPHWLWTTHVPVSGRQHRPTSAQVLQTPPTHSWHAKPPPSAQLTH